MAQGDPVVAATSLGPLADAVGLWTDAFAWVDGRGLIVWCNPAFSALFGTDDVALVGAPVIERLHLLRNGREVIGAAHPARRVLCGEAQLDEIYEVVSGDQHRVVEVFARSGRVAGERASVVCVHDITRLTRAHSEMKLLNSKLEAANAELEAFSYSVSHDLRTPLRAIDGFSQALLEDYADLLQAEGKDYLRRLRAAAQNMGRLIEDLLRLSRVTRAELMWADVDLSAMCRAIGAEHAASAPERSVELVVQDGMSVRGDEHWLRQALHNLIDNAWKFTRDVAHPRIEVGTVEDGEPGDCVFFVRDNGAGFAMERADKLFAVFQRMHSPDEFPGTGVGLALVRRIIHRHGGRIWADAKVGEGATFYFTLPGTPRTP